MSWVRDAVSFFFLFSFFFSRCAVCFFLPLHLCLRVRVRCVLIIILLFKNRYLRPWLRPAESRAHQGGLWNRCARALEAVVGAELKSLFFFCLRDTSTSSSAPR